ncbi:MAG: hypothetical protein ACLFSY_05195 [Desulfonatronovibrionaceae bacterium]
MRDDKGVFYYPNAANKKERMYVRRNEDGDIEFRLWNADYPEIWERHGWLDLDLIKRAAEMYAGKSGDDPKKLYDIHVARAVLNDAEK